MLVLNSWPFIRLHGGVVVAVLLLTIPNLNADASGGRIDYSIELGESGKYLIGSLCNQELEPQDLYLPKDAHWIPNSIQADPNARNNCLRYRKDFHHKAAKNLFDPQANAGITVSSLEQILPCRRGELLGFTTINVEPGDGWQISVPGKRSAPGSFELLQRPCSWSSAIVFGQVVVESLVFGPSKVQVAMPARLSLHQQAKLIRWLSDGFDALSLAFGELPVSDVQVIIFPVGENQEAVPWGQVTRGGGDAVHLYVDETKSLSELNDDWVLVHELSHLLHPYMSAKDGWLSEGIASYYQNVLRARQNLLTPVRAWEKLDAGFRRGEKQFKTGIRLYENTRQMMRERQYMRVYWSGAAIALIGDVQLRQASGGKMSLDRLLKQFAMCCLPTTRKRWRAKELVDHFDKTSGTKIFSRLYNDYVMQAEFPAIDDIYDELGLQRHSSNLHFTDEGGELRYSIMSPNQAAASHPR